MKSAKTPIFSGPSSESPWLGYGLAVAASVLAHFGQWIMSLYLEPTRILLLFPAVFFASWWGGFGPGVISILLCTIGAWIEFEYRAPNDSWTLFLFVVRFGIFILISLFMAVLNGRSLRTRGRIETKRRLLEESESRLKMALKGGRASLWEWDFLTGELWRSEGLDSLFGLPEGAAGLTNETFINLIHPEDRSLVRDKIQGAVARDEDYVVEYRVVWPDQSVHWLHSSGEVDRDAAGRALRMSGSSVDITERKILELELKAAKDVAERSSRAKTDFVSHMSHELRTPLGVIIGFTELALESAEKGSDQHEHLVRVRKSGATLQELIGNILDLAKIEANKLIIERTDFSLPQLMKDLAADASVLAKEKGLQLAFEVDPSVPKILNADVTRLRQILMNLVGNAIKFTEKGRIDVHVRRAPESAGSALKLEFSVADTGIGLTDEQRLRLFQAFTQADSSTTRKYGGTGLGLTLSRQLTKLLGGELKIDKTEPGVGSTFSFTVDAGEARRAPAERAPSAAKPVRDLEGVRVLLVEDSPDNRLLVSRFLGAAGATVTPAENGEEGVQLATAGEFDVILMDIQMPILDGFSAIREMRRREVGTPVIALTAHALMEERQRAFEAGFDDYVTKPINRDVLVQAIRVFAPVAVAPQSPDRAPELPS